MTVRTGRPAFLQTAILVIGVSAAPVGAVDAPKQTAAAPYDSPAVSFPENRISLIDAVRLTLRHDPNLKLSEQQAVFAKGVSQSASGQFDPLLDANASYSLAKTPLTASQTLEEIAAYGGASKELQNKNAGLDLSLVLPFRDGVKVGAIASGGWTNYTYTGGDAFVNDLANATPDVYNASVGFTLDAALLRGRGSDATGAAERAARIDWEATELAYKHAASSSVLVTVSAYWNLVGAQEQLDIARKALDLSSKNVEVTRSLIAGDEIPRAELSRVLASKSTDQGQVAAAERAVMDARVALARAMGVSVLTEQNAPLAADPFPPASTRSVVQSIRTTDLLATALERRFDRQAALKTKESGGVLLTAARINLRPRLDFQGQVTAGTVAEASLSNAGSNWTFPSFSAGLLFEKPFGNNAARGLVLQQDATLGQQAITAADLERVIKANVVQLTHSLGETADQVAHAQEATTFYARTVSDENEKFRSGQSTLIDTITTRQLGTSAALAYSAARQQWATLLAQLRYETGTLVDVAGGKNVVRQETLVSLPQTETAK